MSNNYVIMKNLDPIVSLSKRRGFVYPGSEIYGGFGNSYTYGPLGIELKKNIKDLWWKTFVHQRADMVGIDGDIILHPKTWHASGHVAGFSDQMVDCRTCKARLRADHLVEDALKQDCEGLPDEEVTALIRDNGIKCPKCGGKDLTEVRKFNLMFETQMAKTGEESTAYLRPETAQAIFLEFKNVVDSTRVKIPFGIAQIGKAFRNEITPGNFIFRRLEFEQMEIEYFIHEDDWKSVFEAWHNAMKAWCDLIGLSKEKCHDLEHAPEKLSHYSKRTVDIEYDFPFGRKELYGLAYRTNFDLTQHQEHSGKKLAYRDPMTNEEYIPHVIEPTFGVDRTILAVMCEAYREEKLEDGSERTVMAFKPVLAPIKVAVLPLMKKDGLPEKAREILSMLTGGHDPLSGKDFGNCEYDDGGAIGKRYRRQDEAGTPVCITVDYESLEDETVTVRDRDTMKQERIKIGDLVAYLAEHYFSS
ncbi:MAG TPA: glycine--tRNA ligase [Candidatus Gracilibacteria bacterium]